MSSDYRKALTALTVTLVAGALIDYRLEPARARPLLLPQVPAMTAAEGSPAGGDSGELRVCADPNNMPFSSVSGQGFENVLARMVARDLGLHVHYTWWPQRRGFFRSTLQAGRCDVVMGVPADYLQVLATAVYYRSTYVFVTRRDRALHLQSLDDPRLRSLRIGVHINSPPAQALALRGLLAGVRGYSIYGNYEQPDPPRALIDAVARGDVDVAIAWGPLAGYFAPREPVALELAPVASPGGPLPMHFAISMGVRSQDQWLRRLLDAELAHRHEDIERLLARFGVPLVQPDGAVRLAHNTAE